MTRSPAVVARRTFVTCVNAGAVLSFPGNGVSRCGAAAAAGASPPAAGALAPPPSSDWQPTSDTANRAANGSANGILIDLSPDSLAATLPRADCARQSRLGILRAPIGQKGEVDAATGSHSVARGLAPDSARELGRRARVLRLRRLQPVRAIHRAQLLSERRRDGVADRVVR